MKTCHFQKLQIRGRDTLQFMSFLRQDRTSNKNFVSERVGDMNTQYDLSKLFKPITDMQKELKERPCKPNKTN